MKTYKILLYIISVFALMAAISYAIPSSGIIIANTTLTFPTIADLAQDGTPEMKSGEDAIAEAQAFIDAQNMRDFIKARQLSEQMQHRRNAITNRYAISYPNDSIEWIFPVLEKLENAKKRPIRILHYGDSQIEVDHITSAIRNGMQARFGGNGVGLVPAIQKVPIPAIIQSCNKELPRYVVFGPQNMHREDRHYGPMGQVVEVTGDAEFSLRTRGNKFPAFQQVTVLLDKADEEVEVTVKTEITTIEKRTTKSYEELTFNLPDATNSLTINIKGQCLCYGFMIDSPNNGVAWDNIAMRGCSGTVFTSIEKSSFTNFYRRHDIPLIIMQYGGNSVPYLKSETSIDNYCKSLENQINWVKRIAPDSKILFIGPSDMTTSINGRLQSYPKLKTIVAKLKAMCHDNDVAYWDFYNAMGGENSMIRWASASPALAGSDHIHLTGTGAKRIGEMIFEGMMSAYDYYEYLREEELLPTETKNQ